MRQNRVAMKQSRVTMTQTRVTIIDSENQMLDYVPHDEAIKPYDLLKTVFAATNNGHDWLQRVARSSRQRVRLAHLGS